MEFRLYLSREINKFPEAFAGGQGKGVDDTLVRGGVENTLIRGGYAHLWQGYRRTHKVSD